MFTTEIEQVRDWVCFSSTDTATRITENDDRMTFNEKNYRLAHCKGMNDFSIDKLMQNFSESAGKARTLRPENRWKVAKKKIQVTQEKKLNK